MKYFLLSCFVLLADGLGMSCNSKYEVINVCNDSYGNSLLVFNNVSSMSVCTSLCSNDERCASVLFNEKHKKCTTNSGVLGAVDEGCSLMYAEFIQGNCKVFSTLGNACKTADECYDTGSTCLNWKCTCDAGYSFNPSNFTCLEKCDTYGTSFTALTGYLVKAHNAQKISGSDADSCMNACVEASNITCVTTELSIFGDCYLSEETALTQPDDFIQSPDYTYYQRNCE